MPIFIEKGSQLLQSAAAVQKESSGHEKQLHANSLSKQSRIASSSDNVAQTTEDSPSATYHYLTKMEDMADVLKLDVYITKDPQYNDRSKYHRYKAMKDPSFRLIGKDLIYSDSGQENMGEEEPHAQVEKDRQQSPKKASVLQRFQYLRKQHANDIAHDKTKDFLTIVNESNSTVKAIKAGKPIHTRDQPVSLQEALQWSIKHVRYLADTIETMIDSLDDDIREHLLKHKGKKSPPRPFSPGKYNSARMSFKAFGMQRQSQKQPKDKAVTLAKQLDKLALDNRDSFLSAISPEKIRSNDLNHESKNAKHYQELLAKMKNDDTCAKPILRSSSPPITSFPSVKPASRPQTAQSALNRSTTATVRSHRPTSSSSHRRISRNILKDFQNGTLNLEDLEVSFQDGKFLQSIHDNFKQTMRPVLKEIERHQHRIDHLQHETDHKLQESEHLGMKMLDQYHDFHVKCFAHRKHVEKIVQDKDFFSDHKLSLKKRFLEKRIENLPGHRPASASAGGSHNPQMHTQTVGVDGMVVMHQLESYMNHHEKFIQLEYLSKVPWIGRMLSHLKEIKFRSGSKVPMSVYRILAVYCHVIMLGFIDSKVFTKPIFYMVLDHMIDDIADYQNSIIHRVLSLMRETFHISHHEFAR